MQIPGYRIVERLGAGASGVVYLATQEDLGRQVALKQLAPGLFGEEETRARFVREAKLQARLSHPNVLRLFDAGFAGQQPWLAVEYVRGGSLRDRLQADGRSIPREAGRIGGAIAAGLAHAHAAGIIHRDLKPENVLLAEDGAVKVADFGLAKTVSESQTVVTKAGTALGTPGYLSPEVLMGSKPAPAADVYALGVMIFELVAGRRPFEGDDMVQLFRSQQAEEAPRLSALLEPVPAWLDELVAACLERKPERRPIAAEIARQLAGEHAWPEQLRLRARFSGTLPQTRKFTGSGRPPARPAGARGESWRWWKPLVMLAGGLAAAALAGAVALALRAPVGPAAAGGLAVPAVATADTAPPAVWVTSGIGRARLWFERPLFSGTRLACGTAANPGAIAATLPQSAAEFTLGGLQPATDYSGQLETSGGRSPFAFRTLGAVGDSKAVFLERGMMEDRIDAQTLGEHVGVAWRRWHSEADHVLEFSESPDGGATWSKPVVVAGPGRPIVEMSFAWPPEGPRLAWLEGDGAGQRMAVSKRPTGSRAWSPPAAVASARAVAGQGKGVDNPNGAIDYAMTAHGFRWAVPPGDLSGTPLERAPGTRGAPKPYRVLTTSSGKLALLCSSPAPGKPRAAYLAPVDESGQVLRKRLRPISDPRHDVVTVGAIGRGPTVVVAEEVSEQIWVQASSDAGATFTAAALVFPDQRETRKFGLADSGGVFHIAVLQLGVMQVTGRLLLASSVDGRSWAPWASMRLPLHSEREVALAASGPRLIAFISDQIDGLMTLTLPLPGSR